MGKLVVLVFVLAARIGQCFEDVVGTSFCQLFCSVMPVGWNFLEVWVGLLPRATGIQLYAEGFRPSAYRDIPSAYDTPTAVLGVARRRRPPSAESVWPSA
jgi:hypothetical protein